jgi:hypothetical protein
MPVIPVNRVVDPKRIIRKNGPRRMGPPPPLKSMSKLNNDKKPNQAANAELD